MSANSTVLPHDIEPHPVTGMNNGKFGIWLFLASEVMLFGGLFSAYILLRTGANPKWPLAHLPSPEGFGLSTGIGAFNTLLLILSSVTIVLAWVSCKLNNLAAFKKWMTATILLSVAFLVIKVLFEYLPKLSHGHGPSSNTFYGIYFTLTGLHALHILGGIVVNAYFLFPGCKMWKTDHDRFTGRIECSGLYWHFVDLVWIFLFPTLYLL